MKMGWIQYEGKAWIYYYEPIRTRNVSELYFDKIVRDLSKLMGQDG